MARGDKVGVKRGRLLLGREVMMGRADGWTDRISSRSSGV